MSSTRIAANAAFNTRKTNPTANWVDALPNEGGEVWPSFQSTFSFSSTSTIFTIGSCFARNIEDELGRIGCNVPMLKFRTRPEEWDSNARPSSMLNKFTPPNFRNTVEWAASVFDRDGIVSAVDCIDYALDLGDGTFIDTDTASLVPVSLARLVERRQEIYDVFAYAFKSDVVVLTPGYIEAWLDTKTGHYMAGLLKLKATIRMTGRFMFETRGVEDSVSDLLATIDLIRERRPETKFLVTVSPVPLGTTFTGQDIRIANVYSKAVIRAACGRLPQLRSGVDYFPSYESAMLSDPSRVWKRDRIHVQQSFVESIVARLKEGYVREAPAL